MEYFKLIWDTSEKLYETSYIFKILVYLLIGLAISFLISYLMAEYYKRRLKYIGKVGEIYNNWIKNVDPRAVTISFGEMYSPNLKNWFCLKLPKDSDFE